MDATANYEIEIPIDQIRKYIVSSRSCKFDAGCTLESKFGRVIFNLSSFGRVKSCQIRLKRLSGNGKFCFKIGNGTISSLLVSSKILQNFNIDLDESAKLEITRPNDSNGEVNIFGFALQLQEEGLDLSNKWKTVISKCGKYTCLRMVGNRLFASEGATIENGLVITKLETKPPNMFSRLNQGIKFLGPCEIIDLELDHSQKSNIVPLDHNLYIHREAPTPVLPVQQFFPGNSCLESTAAPNFQSVESLVSIFDSQYAHSFRNNKSVFLPNKKAKLISSNAKDYLVIKRGGIFTLPISDIQSNSEYQIETTIQKLNGNGKIHVGFVSEQNQHEFKTAICIAESSPQTVKFRLGSGDGKSFKLQISMHEDGVGEVLIFRVIVSKKIQQLLHYVEAFNHNHSQYNSQLDFSTNEEEIAPYIRIDTKHAALLDIQSNTFDYSFLEIVGTIEATSFQNKLWLSRILSLFPNVEPIKLNAQTWKDSRIPNIILTSLDTLKPAPRLWLEEFVGPISSTQLEILKQSQEILTPSLPNSIELKNINKKISMCSLEYPYSYITKSEQEKYVIYFEKFPTYTKALLKIWKSNYPKLFVVGSTLYLPESVVLIPEQESYSHLLNLIANAELLIELNHNCHYYNGLINLCQHLSTKVITNNHYYLLKDGITITKSIPFEQKRILDSKNLQHSIEVALASPNYIIDPAVDPKQNILKNMFTLLGIE